MASNRPQPPSQVPSWLQPVLDAAKGLPPPFRFVIVLLALVVLIVLAQVPVAANLAPLFYLLAVGGFVAWAWGEWLLYRSRPPQGESLPGTDALPPESRSEETPVRVDRVATQRPDALRERYLRELWDDCVTLKTTTFKAATGQEAPELELSAVFTDLDVLEVDLRDLDDKAAQSGGRAGHEERRQPALAVLSNHPKLVLLGDPGSGKSTLVDFVTLCLAGDWLRFSDVNLKRLGSAWTLPRLLPLRVILRDYAARGQPNGRSLWQFVQDELAATQTSGGENLAACAGVIEEALRQPDGAILLLDGVDEVPDAHNRRFQLKEAIEQFARDFPHCRVLVTSRPYAYQKGKERFTGFEQRTLADFNLEQMQAFIEKWYAHVGEKDQRLGPDKATAYAEKLQREVKNRPRLQDLAANPLLMALMAWLHRQGEGGALPEKRQLLYEKSVEHLLDLWQREKPLYDEQGRLKGQEYDVFTELGIPPDKLRQALNLLAFEAHRDQPDLVGTHDIAAERLVGVLYQEASDEGKAKGPQRIIEYVTNRAGLLIERSQGRVYRFPHRTFQEYLAACHLTGPDFPYTLYDCLRGHDERWREAVLLAAAKAVGGADAAIWTLIAVFCPHDWPPPDPPVDPDWYAVLRAAQALIATEQHHRVPERQRFLVDRLRLWLAQLLDSPQALANAPLDRAAAGRALAVLGDPRPGVGVIVGAQRAAPPLPGLNWVLIPGTAQVRDSGHAPRPGFNGFKLGDGFKPDPEYHEEDEAWPAGAPPIDIAPFYIAAYPVTVAQFRPFVEGDGYANPDYWTKAGWARCQGEGWRAPRYWNDPVWHLDNHPVVGVSWYEAAAYCHWLTARLRERDEEMKAFVVRLPAEAEWEWAARGPEARRWPWGDTWQAGRCNSAESGIGRTCAVGSFPTGANWVKNLPLSQREAWERGLGGEGKHAVHDLAGNVWEWCSTRWQAKYPLSVVESEWSDSYLEGTDPRALRGGAWSRNRLRARAAYRVRDDPLNRYDTWAFRCCLATSSL